MFLSFGVHHAFSIDIDKGHFEPQFLYEHARLIDGAVLDGRRDDMIPLLAHGQRGICPARSLCSLRLPQPEYCGAGKKVREDAHAPPLTGVAGLFEDIVRGVHDP